jgi:hypothetical protein
MASEQPVAACQLRQWAANSSRAGLLFTILKRMRDEDAYYRPNWWVLQDGRQLIFSEDYILRSSEVIHAEG